MIFYFNSDGTLINSVPSNVYQGSNKASRIYFVCPTANSNVISVAFTLPSGMYSSKRMLTRTQITGNGIGLSSGNGAVVNEEDVGFNVWQYDIPFSVTQYAGRVTVQFFIDDGTETVATQSVAFTVQTGSGVVDPELSNDEYQDIINTITNNQQITANEINELNKTVTRILSVTDSFTNFVPESGGFYKWYNASGIEITDLTPYQSGYCVNDKFATFVKFLNVGPDNALPPDNDTWDNTYIIFREPSTTSTDSSVGAKFNYRVYSLKEVWSNVQKGALIFVINYAENYPSRFYGGYGHFFSVYSVVDSVLSINSTNPVQNKVIAEALAEQNLQIAQQGEELAGQKTQIEQLQTGKQDELTFDSTPTQGSTNPVTSGGIFNSIQNVLEVAEGKTETFVLSYNQTLQVDANSLWYDSQGTNIASQIGTGNYISENFVNSRFNSQENPIRLSDGSATDEAVKFIVTIPDASVSNVRVIYTVGELRNLKTGATILMIETDVPDRWLAGNAAYVLESQKKSAVTVNGQIVPTFNADSKQNVLTFDDTPTEGSENPVTSGGVYDSEQEIKNNILNRATVYYLEPSDTFTNLTGEFVTESGEVIQDLTSYVGTEGNAAFSSMAVEFATNKTNLIFRTGQPNKYLVIPRAEISIGTVIIVPNGVARVCTDAQGLLYVATVPIKTINDQSLYGRGNIQLTATGETISVDSELLPNSTNPVENQVVYNALQKKQNKYLLFTTDGFGSEGTFYNENNQQITDLTNYAGKQINAQFASTNQLLSLTDYTEKYFIFRTQSDALANNEYLVMPVSNIKTGDYICVAGTGSANRFCAQVGSTIIFEADGAPVDNALSDTSTNPVENRVVYQTKQELLSAINTKPVVHVLSYSDNFSSSGTFKDSAGNIITPNTGNYTNSYLQNGLFNSQESSITLTGGDGVYIITRVADSESASSANGYYFLVLSVNEFAQETNKIIRIVENDVPDRWAPYGKTCYEVEGSLNDYSRYGSAVVSSVGWSAISEPETYYTHEATLVVSSVLTQLEINNKRCILTLFNNNPTLFIKHGFAVQSVTVPEGSASLVYAKILSIGAPTENIAFEFKGEVIE